MKWTFLWTVATVFWSGFGFAADLSCSGAPPRIDAEPFRFEDVSRLVRCKHIASIDELLPLLPQNFRARFSLVYASGSRHGASVEFPRIIMNSDDARMILAIAGDSSQRNGNILESIQYNDSESQFEFHSIDFAPRSRPDTPTKISEKNPQLCASCHRSNFSPNWESYPLWPGVYGSGSSSGRIEDEAYARFAVNAARQGRYRQLDRLSSDLSLSELEFRNHSLSEALGQLNKDRVASGLHAQPRFARARYAIAASFLNCAELETFIPGKVRGHFSETYANFHEKIQRTTLAHFNSQETRVATLTGNKYFKPSAEWDFFFEAEPAIGAGYFSQELLGLDLNRYSLSRDGGLFDSHHTLGGLPFDRRITGEVTGSEDCSQLKLQSLQALSL